MPTDLSIQIRSLVEVAQPVTAEEAIARAESYPSALNDASFHHHRHTYVRPTAVAASAIVLAGVGIGWAISSHTSSPSTTHRGVSDHSPHPKVMLTAAEIRAITTHSSAAAASSGTAEATQTSVQNGVPQDGYTTAVTFDGSNIDEKITSVPEPAGSAKSFTTDDRFVDGQFYIYTPGPGDVLEWLHDTDSSNDAASMQFPDPRTLYNAISPAAQFAVEGTATINGSSSTELKALDPSAIESSALGNLVAGATLTSFELWVDRNDVVQRIALMTSTTNQACQLRPLSNAQLRQYGQTETLPNGKKGVVLTPAGIAQLKAHGGEKCGPMTTTSSVTVTFANLGVPQSISVPSGAVSYLGKG